MLIYAHSRGGAAIAGVAAPAQLVPPALPAPVFAAVVEVTSQPRTALTVSNTGPGVPAAQVPALFKQFRRPHRRPDRPRGGAGLSLSIVRSITAAHRGTVRARPGPGAA